MKFLIAGLGSIGRRHFRNLLALGERDIVLYRTHQSTLPDDELADFPCETTIEAALAHQPDVVIVANPTALHLDVAIPAALAGCHLLLEKPVSHSLEGMDELGAALQSGGGKVLVGFQFRFHPGLQKIAQLLVEKAIGQPVSAHAHWGEYLPGWHPWEDYRNSYSARPDLGGGVALTLCHPLDYLRWLMGEVQTGSVATANLGALGIEVPEVAEFTFRFSNGAIGTAHLDFLQRPATHTLEIIGSEGTILWDNAFSAARVYRANTGKWERYPAPEGFERNTMFLDELKHMIAVARGEVEPLCTLQDGRRALELALLDD